MRRRRKVRVEKTTCLLVGEGRETEYNYLSRLSADPIVRERYAVTVRKPGQPSPGKLVDRAIRLREEARNDPQRVPDGFDEVWCVLDVETADNFQQLRRALEEAEENDIRVCLSNPCFEVWFLAHFIKTHREFANPDEAIAELSKRWKKEFKQPYNKTDEGNYKKLERLLDDAIKNARCVRESFHDKTKPTIDCNSSTDVYKLVSKLLGKEEGS